MLGTWAIQCLDGKLPIPRGEAFDFQKKMKNKSSTEGITNTTTKKEKDPEWDFNV